MAAFPPTRSTSSPGPSRHYQEEGVTRASLPGARGSETSYLSLLVAVLHAQSVHGPDDGGQRLDGVAVDNRLVLLYIFSREAVFMDDPGGNHRPHPMSAVS